MLEARPDLDEAARLVEIDGALPTRQIGRSNLEPRPAARPRLLEVGVDHARAEPTAAPRGRHVERGDLAENRPPA